jgi:hypothetical protein
VVAQGHRAGVSISGEKHVSVKLPKSWPPLARAVLLDAARFFYHEMSEPFPVYDVNMERAIEYVNRELARRQRELYEEASSKWIDRWESGRLDAEMKRAIDETYGRLRRGERAIRPRRAAAKKRSAQLDRDIAQSIAERVERGR